MRRNARAAPVIPPACRVSVALYVHPRIRELGGASAMMKNSEEKVLGEHNRWWRGTYQWVREYRVEAVLRPVSRSVHFPQRLLHRPCHRSGESADGSGSARLGGYELAMRSSFDGEMFALLSAATSRTPSVPLLHRPSPRPIGERFLTW